MRIAIDVRPLQNESGLRGVGRYVRSLTAAMPDEGDEFLYVESRWGRDPGLPAGARGSRVGLARPTRVITLFDQIATPALCRRLALDLFHSTFYALPRLGAGRTRLVLTVHDLIPLVHPGAVGLKNTAIFEAIYRSARAADAVIVPSNRTASDLISRIGLPADRIRVIPMGVGAPFGFPDARTARPPRDVGGDLLAKHPGGTRLEDARRLLYAGGFDRTKNVPFLIAALRELRDPRALLCIAGDAGGAENDLLSKAAEGGVAGQVVFLGRLEDGDLAEFHRSADLFVSASLYEGFGLPSLEAMACGCPVVALETAAVPEVLSGAALVVDEATPEAFAAGIRRALADEALRADLARKGLARAASLSWDRTARATLDLYREVTAPPRPTRS